MIDMSKGRVLHEKVCWQYYHFFYYYLQFSIIRAIFKAASPYLILYASATTKYKRPTYAL